MYDTIDDIAQITEGQGRIAAVAIHDGHLLREEAAQLSVLDEPTRLREEDPHTGVWTTVADTQVVASKSRFEVDLNRPRDRAVYRVPDDAWGLDLWSQPLPDALVDRSLAAYDTFYIELERVLTAMQRRSGHFVVLDLHTYNHRRDGPDGPAADPELNPEVNVGTGSVDRDIWGPLVDRFTTDLASHAYLGRHLDVRENVRFRGGHLSSWVHQRFPATGCCLAIEFRKSFMDEWTGEVYPEEYEAIPQALQATLHGLSESLDTLERVS